jgi:hypothetical protein
VADFYLSQGDRLPPMVMQLILPDGSFPDLAGTSNVVSITPYGADTPDIGGACSILLNPKDGFGTPTDAQVEFDWPAPITAGTYNMRVRTTYLDGRQITFPNHGYKVLEINPP